MIKPIRKPGQAVAKPVVPKKEKKPPAKNYMLLSGIASVIVVAFIIFSPGLTGSFLGWDDYKYISENDLLRTFSLANILHVFHFKTFVAGNYHPLTVLSNMIEYQVAGLNPFLYHFDNLLLHLFNILFVARLTWLLTKRNYATLIVAALFAVHPMRVESVVWAAERKDVLYAFFFLLSLISYTYYLLNDQKKIYLYVLSLFFFLLSILSKGQAVVLPLTLFLLDYWILNKVSTRSILNKLPFFLLSVASGILAVMAQRSSLTEQRLTEHSFFERVSIAGYNLAAYIYKLIYPFDLSSFYKYPAASDMWQVYAGALVAVVIILLLAILFRKNKTVVFGSLFYLFTISIVTQILPVGNAIIADRYTYIPYFGLFFIAGNLLGPLIGGKKQWSKVTLAACLMIFLAFSVKTFSQAKIWQSDKTLWESAIAHDPANGLAYSNLGCYYIEQENYPAAISALENAIRNEKTFTESYFAFLNMGVACSREGRDEEAIGYLNRALELRPGLQAALFARGLSFTAVGNFDSAVDDFTAIVTGVDSLNAQAYYSRGIANNKRNRMDEALSDYAAAIRIDPNYVSPYINRGNIYFNNNRLEEALADYNTALKLEPGNGKTWLNRSSVYFRMQKFSEALKDAMMARDLKVNVHPGYIRDLERLQ